MTLILVVSFLFVLVVADGYSVNVLVFLWIFIWMFRLYTTPFLCSLYLGDHLCQFRWVKSVQSYALTLNESPQLDNVIRALKLVDP